MSIEGGENFEDLVWLFRCDSRNRGIIRQGFDEAALLWKAVKATPGAIIEVGRNKAGSTVLLAAASAERTIYSIDIRLKNNSRCDDYLKAPQHKDRVQVLVADSRQPLAGVKCGLLFIDGDHSFKGVLADVMAHWNALRSVDTKPGLAAFHDALPNENFKWRDEDRRFKRFWIRFKNKFRSRQKPEIAQDYSVGVSAGVPGPCGSRIGPTLGGGRFNVGLKKAGGSTTGLWPFRDSVKS